MIHGELWTLDLTAGGAEYGFRKPKTHIWDSDLRKAVYEMIQKLRIESANTKKHPRWKWDFFCTYSMEHLSDDTADNENNRLCWWHVHCLIYSNDAEYISKWIKGYWFGKRYKHYGDYHANDGYWKNGIQYPNPRQCDNMGKYWYAMLQATGGYSCANDSGRQKVGDFRQKVFRRYFAELSESEQEFVLALKRKWQKRHIRNIQKLCSHTMNAVELAEALLLKRVCDELERMLSGDPSYSERLQQIKQLQAECLQVLEDIERSGARGRLFSGGLSLSSLM